MTTQFLTLHTHLQSQPLEKNLYLTVGFPLYRRLISSSRSKVQFTGLLPCSYQQSKQSLWAITELKVFVFSDRRDKEINMSYGWVSCSDPCSFTVYFKSSAEFQQFRSNPVQWSGTIRKYLSIASQNLVLYNSGETTVGILPKTMKDKKRN